MLETTEADLRRAEGIAAVFRIPRPVRALPFADRGNMSHEMYLIVAGEGPNTSEYLLQRMNHAVFTNPTGVVEAMQACTKAQRQYLKRHKLPEGVEWSCVELVQTEQGEPILELRDAESVSYWRMMVRIPGCVCFKSLGDAGDRQAQLHVARQAARGLALFGDLTSAMKPRKLKNPLPGYRDTALYYAQLDAIMDGCRTLKEAERYLPEDPEVRSSTQFHFMVSPVDQGYEARMAEQDLQHYISLALEYREFALTIAKQRERGKIRTVAIHGDTKLDNFLFDSETRNVRALVDLDTIMPHSWLADWGDMARSLVNVVGEIERDLSKVRVDLEVFDALAEGFLTTAREVQPNEVELMVDAVQILALELGTRFLTDYLRGNTYFSLSPNDPQDLNKVRAKVQLKLFEELLKHTSEMRECVERWASRSLNSG